MTKKKNKLDPNWIVWLIDATVGHRLMILGMRSPNSVKTLGNLLIRIVADAHETTQPTKETQAEFIEAVSATIVKSVDLYIAAKAKYYLREGVPRAGSPPVILH